MKKGTATRTNAKNRLRRHLGQGWRPRRRETPVEWLPRRVRLTQEYESARGPYELSARPWFAEVAEVCADPDVRFVRIKACTQSGKTLLLCAVLLYLAENSPAPAMCVLPGRDEAVEFRDRLYSLAAASGIPIPVKRQWNTRWCDLGEMRVYLAWPRSSSRLRSRRCKYVFRSEVDVFEGRGNEDPIEASNQRVKAFYRSLILDESTPLPEVSRIEQMEAESDQRRWWATCPHCGVEQELRFFTHAEGPLAGRCGFAGLKDKHGQWLPPDAARQTAHYVCKSGCRITNDEKATFVRNGRWVASKKHASGRSVGFHLWRIHSHYSFGDIAAEYLTARGDGKLPDFFQNVLGLCHRQRGKMPTWRELGTRLAYTHERGTVPLHTWFLTAGGDVQEREVYVTVRGWWGNCTSALVDWFVFERSEGDDGDLVKSDLQQIWEYVLRRSFPIVGGDVNPRGRRQLKVALLGIDGQHRTMDVHNWRRSLREHDQERVRIVRGEAQVKPDQKYKMTEVQHAKRDKGKVYEGGLELWNINPEVFRADLAGRFRSSPDKPGAWYVTRDAIEVGKFYLKQVVNEPLVFIRGKDGRYKAEWRERDSTLGHDFWDGETYSRAMAEMVVDSFGENVGWDENQWPRPQKRQKPRPDGVIGER